MTTKIAVSLPDDLVVAARAAVAAGRADSVSAYVSEAMAKVARDDELGALVADLIAEHGVPSEADYRWAEQALGLA